MNPSNKREREREKEKGKVVLVTPWRALAEVNVMMIWVAEAEHLKQQFALPLRHHCKTPTEVKHINNDPRGQFELQQAAGLKWKTPER